MGYYRSLFVVKDSNVSLGGFIDPYASLWVIMFFLGPHTPLLILICPYGFL